MSPSTPIILAVGFIIVFCILVVFYNTYYLKYITEEHFTNYNTTLRQYENGKDFHTNKDMKHFFNYNTYDDVKKLWPLNTYGCIKTNVNHDIENEVKELFYVSVSEFYSISVNDIFQKIVEDLEKTRVKINTEKIENPVYVVIYQAPYLRFNNEEIVARNDSINNYKPSFNQNINNVKIGEKQLYTKIMMLYPNYKSHPENTSYITKYNDNTGFKHFKTYFNSLISRDKLCFLECNGVNDYNCGCINRKEHDKSVNFYQSKCTDMQNNQFNFGMLYQLNNLNKLFSDKINLID